MTGQPANPSKAAPVRHWPDAPAYAPALALLCATALIATPTPTPTTAGHSQVAYDTVTRVIAGVVQDSAGHPVAGAMVGVRVHALTDRVFHLPGGAGQLPADIAFAFGGGLITYSGTDGRFRLAVPVVANESSAATPADTLLEATVLAAGYLPVIQDLPRSRAPVAVEMLLGHGPWRDVVVLVHGPDGRPLPGVQLRTPVTSANTDSAGRVTTRVPLNESVDGIIAAAGDRPAALTLAGTDGTPKPVAIRLHAAIHGTVVDARGRPVAGALVGDHSTTGPDRTSRIGSFAGTVVQAAADGRFMIATPLSYKADGSLPANEGLGARLVAGDSALSRMGFATMPDTQDPTPPPDLRIVLRGTRQVDLPVMPERPASTSMTAANVIARPRDGRQDVLAFFGTPQRPAPGSTRDTVHYEMRLPPGPYKLRIPAETGEMQEMPLVIPPGHSPVVAPVMRIGHGAIMRLVGTRAPEIEASALDGRPVHLADYRGRIIVLDFWGTWCVACVEALPELAHLQQVYRQNGVVFLALHDVTAHNAADFNQLFAPIRAGAAFGNHDLPLAVLLDRPRPGQEHTAPEDRESDQGRTVHAYRVTGFPTTLVIGPTGMVLGEYRAEDLDKVLQRLVGHTRS
jgi:thiol-disulfide isomerase/thioredoxin